MSSKYIQMGEKGYIVTAGRDISERVVREQERGNLIEDLQHALARIKTLHGVLPICSSCKKIRDDEGSWKQLESYIVEHSDVQISHGLCTACAKKLYPSFYSEDQTPSGNDANGTKIQNPDRR